MATGVSAGPTSWTFPAYRLFNGVTVQLRGLTQRTASTTTVLFTV